MDGRGLSGLGEALPQVCVTRQGGDCLGQRGGAGGLEEPSVVGVRDDFGNAASIGSEDAAAGEHSLDQGQSEGLAVGGQQNHVRGGEQGWNIFLKTGEDDALLKAEAGGQLFKAAALGAFAGDEAAEGKLG